MVLKTIHYPTLTIGHNRKLTENHLNAGLSPTKLIGNSNPEYFRLGNSSSSSSSSNLVVVVVVVVVVVT